MFGEIVTTINNVIWSPPLVVLILAAGIFLSVYLKFPQIRFGKDMAKLTVQGEKSDAGISPFQAFAATVGSRVGMGNIAGVGTAIFFGGPGAVFWMWIVTLFGSASAFVESSLGQAYKTRNKATGEFIGGPSYFIEKGLHLKWVAVAFALATVIGPGITMPGLHTNSIASVFNSAFGTSEILVAVILVVCMGLVVCGGVKRIGSVAEILAPFMCVLYVFLAIFVMVKRAGDIGPVFALIFKSAFGMEQAFAGIMGATISWGVKRGIYSNEAGQGSGAIVSSATETSHPAKQGFVQIFSVYIDTFLICTASALIILLSGFYNVQGADGSLIVNQAGDTAYGILYAQIGLSNVLGSWSGKLLAIAVVMFVFTSLMGYYYEAEVSVNYLFHGKKKAVWAFRAIFLASVFSGVLIKSDALWSMGDLGVGLMAWINIIAILALSKKSKAILKDYEIQKKAGYDPAFDPAEFGIEDEGGAWSRHAADRQTRKLKQ